MCTNRCNKGGGKIWLLILIIFLATKAMEHTALFSALPVLLVGGGMALLVLYLRKRSREQQKNRPDREKKPWRDSDLV